MRFNLTEPYPPKGNIVCPTSHCVGPPIKPPNSSLRLLSPSFFFATHPLHTRSTPPFINLSALSRKPLHSRSSLEMLFSKSTVIALLSVIAVTAEVPSPSIPDQIGVKSTGKTVLITDDFPLPGSSFTVAPTVSTPTVSTPTVSTPTSIQPTTMLGSTDAVIPDHTHQPLVSLFHPFLMPQLLTKVLTNRPYLNSSAILTATTTGSRGSPGHSSNSPLLST